MKSILLCHRQRSHQIARWLGIGAVLFGAIFLLAAASFASEEAEVGTRIWYVATSGSDTHGNGTPMAPLRSIQRAIDRAQGGDEVVVSPGVYRGPGNQNLATRGKHIAIRSEDPTDPVIVGETIIEADETAVIARFVHDESPQTVFEGFTLRGGDKTSAFGRGANGYFVFSQHARPTIRYVAVEPRSKRTSADVSRIATQGPAPYDEARAWAGLNPFHQPSRTSDYYGSGDVDNDGQFNAADALALEAIIQGDGVANVRADVDGSGSIDDADLKLLNTALAGAKLPGWWNDLDSREARETWAKKIIAQDKTDEHPYGYWFQCSAFAAQFLIRATGYRNDLGNTFYDGNEALFNMPVYTANVMSDSFGHTINAILVGDDPLDFRDWYFHEPQTDELVQPGMWDMPYNSDIYIYSPLLITRGSLSSDGYLVEFHVRANGKVDYVKHYSGFVTQRPAQSPSALKTERHRWNSDLFSFDGSPHIVYEALEESLSRHRRLHVAELPLQQGVEGATLATSGTYSNLLDVATDGEGKVHILWESDADYLPGVFYAQLDTTKKKLLFERRLSSGERQVVGGRLLVTHTGDVHAVWLDAKNNFFDQYDPGLYWAQKTNAGWRPTENLTPELYQLAYLDWETPYLSRSTRGVFDIAETGDGAIVVVWLDPSDEDSWVYHVRAREYRGSWGPEMTVYASDAWYVTLATDATGSVHLVYAYHEANSYGRFGNLAHTFYSSGAWTNAESIASYAPAGYPNLTASVDGKLGLVWNRQSPAGGAVVPVWGVYDGTTWSLGQEIAISAGADAWYPRAMFVEDNQLLVSWNEHTPELVTIRSLELETANRPPTAEAGGAYEGDEGVPVVFDGTRSADPDGSVVLYEWDLDSDGRFDDATGPTPQATFLDDGEYGITLRVTDSYGTTNTDVAQVTIRNVPPIVHAGKDWIITENTLIDLEAVSYTDIGELDTHLAVVDWGDATPVEHVSANNGAVVGTHIFTEEGNYRVEVCVTDDDNGSSCDTFGVTVRSQGIDLFLPLIVQ